MTILSTQLDNDNEMSVFAMFLIAILFIVYMILTPVHGTESNSLPWIVEIRSSAMCDFCKDSIWLDTLERRPFLAGGQYSSAKWTLPAYEYRVTVISKGSLK